MKVSLEIKVKEPVEGQNAYTYSLVTVAIDGSIKIVEKVMEILKTIPNSEVL